jgi:hypothetical protein
LVEGGERSDQLLVDAAEEHGSGLLGQYGRVLSRKRELLAVGLVLEVAGSVHPAQPLAYVPFVEPEPRRQVLAAHRSVSLEGLQQSEAIAERAEQRRHRAAEIAECATDKRLDCRLVDCPCCCHLTASLV